MLFFVDRCDCDGDEVRERRGRAARADRAGDGHAGEATTLSVVRYNAGGTPRPAAGAQVVGAGVDARRPAATAAPA